MPRRPSTWTLYFPRFKCPHCRRMIRTRFSGGIFRFDKAERGESRGGRGYVKQADRGVSYLRETVDSNLSVGERD